MNIKPTTHCAVICGRFHFHELQKTHIDLIQKVVDKHEKTLIILGLSPVRNSLVNPLEFKHRKAVINEVFPNLEVHYIDDNRDDVVWSKNLDKQITKWTSPGQTVTVYGGNDNLLKVYKGKYPTAELESDIFVSSAEIRRNIINSYPPTKDFRAGLIAATGLRYPTCFTAVDIAVYDKTKNQILLARKPGEKQYRFVGGFSDPQNNSFESDAIRELKEETGLTVGENDLTYLGTSKIDDWRYRGSVDCIKTIFFLADYQGGTPQADDDIEEVRWFSLTDINEDVVVYEHKVLVELLRKWFLKNNPSKVGWTSTTKKEKTLLHG